MSRKPVFTIVAVAVLAVVVVASLVMLRTRSAKHYESVTSASSAPSAEQSPPPPAGKESEQRAYPAETAMPQALPVPPPEASQSLVQVERYPNIEAPDTVFAGQEIAVQVSLTSEQISPETKILSGAQRQGRLQLPMAEGERHWTLTVILTAPGMEITRGGTNTAEITLARDSDSSIAVFYLRAQPLVASNGNGKRDTRILATLWRQGAFLARLSRPLTIVAAAPTRSAASNEGGASTQSTPPESTPATPPMAATAPTRPSSSSSPAVQLDPAMAAPNLTIIENRVGNILRLIFYSPPNAPVEADIPNPDALHAWINAHFAQMASRDSGLVADPADKQNMASAHLHARDYLSAFGAELYDRFAPQAFKDLFFKLLNEGPGKLETIQVFSDDPALPWELMKPAIANSTERMDFLGARFSIARWPLTRRGAMRPPQSLAVEKSVVIAPNYEGMQTLEAANLELATLKKMRGFTEVAGNYAAVREVAAHPPPGIVHFAGHGSVIERRGVPQFAILLQDSEMDPATWRALGASATATHPLFFFNACDVGESQRFMNDVDGWAPALLESGASGYIGALWPVSDEIAELFASTFYGGVGEVLEANKNLSVAGLLMMTRRDVFRKTHDATALAYVFYGDPKLVLRKPRGGN
jgi:hypothetical protein